MLHKFTRKRSKELGLAELIAIALGGMVGGGIFSILGVSVEHVGNATPVAIVLGGILAMFAAYSYAKLAVLYKDEGATYSFFKRTFPKSPFASSAIGWLIVFGYISTLALYAYTFSTYLGSVLPFERSIWLNRAIAAGVITLFATVNLISVSGMGKVEDWMVYTKLIILLMISGLLAGNGKMENFTPIIDTHSSFLTILMVSSITFVAYEGFQLVINAYNESDDPDKNVPKAIYSSIVIAILLYLILALGAIATIPKEIIIQDKEFALAAGTKDVLGKLGLFIVIFGALLATSSAINGTLFGASRLMAAISADGYFPKSLSRRIRGSIPGNAIIVMAAASFLLLLTGGLQSILEFGSITFIVVSFLMAYANYRKRKETGTPLFMAFVAMGGLLVAEVLIFYYEIKEAPKQMVIILSIYATLILSAYFYARFSRKKMKA